MVQARKDGGWVAGKVDMNTWDIRDVAEAQDSFFARCAKVSVCECVSARACRRACVMRACVR